MRTLAASSMVFWLLAATIAAAGAAEPEATPDGQHRALGMFSVTSDAGGAVWTFRDDGVVRLIGPGAAFAQGDWSAPEGDPARFEGSIDVATSEQTLTFKGAASSDGTAIALLVTATEPGFDAGKFNWPTESRLIGKRVTFVDVDPTDPPVAAASASPGESSAPTMSPAPGASGDPAPGASGDPAPGASGDPAPGASGEPAPSGAPETTPVPMRSDSGECAIWNDDGEVAWGACAAPPEPEPSASPSA